MVIDVLERDDLPFPRSLPEFLGIAGDITAPTYAELYAKNHCPLLHLV